MNRLDVIATATALAETLMDIAGFRSFAFDYYADQMLPGSLPFGVAGWALTTYGPLVAAPALWRWAKRLPWGKALWVHALLLPCAIAIFWVGDALMHALISDPDFDSTLGALEMPALLSLAVAIVSYYAAVAIRGRHGWANGR
jgi:hypothetical protein